MGGCCIPRDFVVEMHTWCCEIWYEVQIGQKIRYKDVVRRLLMSHCLIYCGLCGELLQGSISILRKKKNPLIANAWWNEDSKMCQEKLVCMVWQYLHKLVHTQRGRMGLASSINESDGLFWPVREGTTLYMLKLISTMIKHGAWLRQAWVLRPARWDP